MIKQLMKRLKRLVDSVSPDDSTLIDAEEAKYILSLMGEVKELQEDLDQVDEIHFDALAECRANVMKVNKRIS